MTAHDPDVRAITRDELLHKTHSGAMFVLVDVLPHEQFLQAHLPGSINVPVNLLRDLAPLLFGRDDEIVVYCSNPECTQSTTAAKILMQLGYTQVLAYEGGIMEWYEAGLPLVLDTPPVESHHHHEEEAA